MRMSWTLALAGVAMLAWTGPVAAQNMTPVQFSPPAVKGQPAPSIPGAAPSAPAASSSGVASMTNPLSQGAPPAPAGTGYNCNATNVTPHGQFGWHCFFNPARPVGEACTCPAPAPTRSNPNPQPPRGVIIH